MKNKRVASPLLNTLRVFKNIFLKYMDGPFESFEDYQKRLQEYFKNVRLRKQLNNQIRKYKKK